MLRRQSAAALAGRTPILLALALLAAVPVRSDDAEFGEFAAEIDALRRTHRIPGLAAAVVRDGQLAWAAGFGVADVDEEVPVTPDTPFWIASITKTFVGLVFLQLEEDGIIDLDDRMDNVPEFREFCDDLAAAPSIFGRGLDCAAPITVRTVLTHTAAFDAGRVFSYNPILFSRLSRYVEWIVNGSTEIEGGMNELARQIEARILSPAGMTRTVASQWDRRKMDVVYDMARGYGLHEGRWVLRPPPKRANAGGAGVVSTVRDLARYIAALEASALAPAAIVRRMLTPPAARDGHPLPYAYGWYVQEFRGELLAWHSGWDEAAGASSLLLWLPDRRLAFVVLANGEGVWWNNPLDEAAVERSDFAAAFLGRFVFRP